MRGRTLKPLENALVDTEYNAMRDRNFKHCWDIGRRSLRLRHLRYHNARCLIPGRRDIVIHYRRCKTLSQRSRVGTKKLQSMRTDHGPSDHSPIRPAAGRTITLRHVTAAMVLLQKCHGPRSNIKFIVTTRAVHYRDLHNLYLKHLEALN